MKKHLGDYTVNIEVTIAQKKKSVVQKLKKWWKGNNISPVEKLLVEADIPFISHEDYIEVIDPVQGEFGDYVYKHYYNTSSNFWVFQVDEENGIFGKGIHEFVDTYITHQELNCLDEDVIR